jgi:hypothetical protein
MVSEDGKTNDSERMRKLAEIKEVLERKIADTESELERLKILLELVNKTLLEKGFKRAEIAKTKQPPTSALPPIVEYLTRDSMRVVVAEGEAFSVKTSPFQQFFVERVLSKMQEKDREAVERGELLQEKALSYELVLDDNTIREIVIRNLTADRLRELRSSIHWTLEKMHEKVKKDV